MPCIYLLGIYCSQFFGKSILIIFGRRIITSNLRIRVFLSCTFSMTEANIRHFLNFFLLKQIVFSLIFLFILIFVFIFFFYFFIILLIEIILHNLFKKLIFFLLILAHHQNLLINFNLLHFGHIWFIIIFSIKKINIFFLSIMIDNLLWIRSWGDMLSQIYLC